MPGASVVGEGLGLGSGVGIGEDAAVAGSGTPAGSFAGLSLNLQRVHGGARVVPGQRGPRYSRAADAVLVGRVRGTEAVGDHCPPAGATALAHVVIQGNVRELDRVKTGPVDTAGAVNAGSGEIPAAVVRCGGGHRC